MNPQAPEVAASGTTAVSERSPAPERSRQWESEALLVAGKLHLFYYFRNWAIALAPIDIGDVPSPFAADVRQGSDAPK